MASILIAEDDCNVADLMRRFLARLGHTCQCAPDGLTALAHLDTQPFDLLITDLELPGLSGVDLMRCVLGTMPRPRILACSGLADQSEAAALADRMLPKPFMLDHLRAVLADLLPSPVAARHS